MRVNGAENWLLLGQGEGAANAEWQRQVERIRVLDGLGGDVEEESACVRSYAARISARELGDGWCPTVGCECRRDGCIAIFFQVPY